LETRTLCGVTLLLSWLLVASSIFTVKRYIGRLKGESQNLRAENIDPYVADYMSFSRCSRYPLIESRRWSLRAQSLYIGKIIAWRGDAVMSSLHCKNIWEWIVVKTGSLIPDADVCVH
jgi:hypothetical protein